MNKHFVIFRYTIAVVLCLMLQSFNFLNNKYFISDKPQSGRNFGTAVNLTGQCSPISSLDCPALVKSLPFNLNFTGSEGGLRDKNGVATGFSMVDKPSAPLITPTNVNIPGYEPSKLQIAAGKFMITTTAGISYLNLAQSPKTNSQVNALGIGFVAPSKFTIQTTLVQPSAGTGKSEQAGLWFGVDEDNYVKLVAQSAGSGTSKIEMRKEIAAISSLADVKTTGAMTLSSSTVKLKFLIDKAASSIQGLYSINGGAELSLGTLNIPQSFTDGKTLSDGVTKNITFGGIFATHRSAVTALTFSFEDFKIERTSPSVVSVNPPNNTPNVSENTSISTDILNLPNSGINNATITSSSVYLTENVTGVVVPANVNGTGGGDAITLVPVSSLKLSTTYKFNITSAVKDLSGASFIPYTSLFTTKSNPTNTSIKAQFSKINLPNGGGRHSSLTIGPDGKLYALTIDGIIKRFSINSDGSLATPQLLYSIQDAYGTRKQRLAIGLAFDPAATATNLIAWVTHSSYVFLDGPDWDGKLTKLTGSNLQSVQDVIINLPRSVKDHLSNSIAFGPDGAVYFTQASNSAMGSADNTWGMRDEHLLSAAVLRLDRSKLGTLPLNVKTSEGGGTYNPYSSTAPLTIYASGLRNAYDLLWHSNGQLYVPTNGSAAGGNTPASVPGTLRPDGTSYNGPSIPALINVQQTQKDFLFRVLKGGYYGHSNALRGEYVLNGGNPTASVDSGQINAYPVGTLPDVKWKGYAFDFQNNKSPNGVIEYKSNTFNGSLKGKVLVVRYSQHDDIIALTPGGTNKDITSSNEGFTIPGFTGFIDPLDLVENVNNGNIYVSEYGGDGKITLLKPIITTSIAIISPGNNASFTSPATINMEATANGGNGTISKVQFYSGTILLHTEYFAPYTYTWNNVPAGSYTLTAKATDNNSLVTTSAIVNVSVAAANLLNTSSSIKGSLTSKPNNANQSFTSINSSKDLLAVQAITSAILVPSCDEPSGALAPSVAPADSLRVIVDNAESILSSQGNFQKPKVYPNPVKNTFNIKFPAFYEGNILLQIADPIGRVYNFGNFNLGKSGSKILKANISTLFLKNGIYILIIHSDVRKNQVIKFIVQND